MKVPVLIDRNHVVGNWKPRRYGLRLFGYIDLVIHLFDKSRPLLGVKASGYWPGNAQKGIANHQSTVVLSDPETGQLKALVAGNCLTALRTAAAAAASIKRLAREGAETLGIVG